MHVIPLAKIIIPDNRQRREFLPEAINDLASSIKIRGLIHPIVVAPDPSGNYRLVAGERRLRAVVSLAELSIPFTCGTAHIPSGSIPVTLLGELDALTLEEIELEENVIRVDLTWQERCTAIERLDSLRRKQNPAHNTTATAVEVLGDPNRATIITENLIVSKHLDDPDIAKAKTLSEAVKVLKRKKDAEHREKLAAAVDLSATPHRILEGDTLTLLPTLPDEAFNCICTDPPYGVGANTFGDQSDLEHKYEDSFEYAVACYTALAREGFRIAKPQAHIYAFCAPEFFYYWKGIFEFAGWKVWPRPLIWYKGNVGILPRPEHGPRYCYETILFASKGDKPICAVRQDVLVYNPPMDRIHAAEKPTDLYADLLSRSTLPGDVVLDCFAGSGVMFTAANRLKLRALLIEKEISSITSCKSRILGSE